MSERELLPHRRRFSENFNPHPKAHIPFRGEHPCFGQRSGFCRNRSTWRQQIKNLTLYWCDACKKQHHATSPGRWEELKPRL